MASSLLSGKTKICGVIGDPIEHTVSPVMHNAAFKKLGLDYIYIPFRVREEELGKAVDGIRALNVRGLNVTIPHKVAIMPMLDGFRTTRLLKYDCRFKDIPIIVLTSRATEGERKIGEMIGADELLYKPFRSPQVLTLVHRYLNG